MIAVMITWRYLAFDLRDITGSISAPQAAQASSVVLTVRRLGGVLIRAMQPFSGHPPAKGNRGIYLWVRARRCVVALQCLFHTAVVQAVALALEGIHVGDFEGRIHFSA